MKVKRLSIRESLRTLNLMAKVSCTMLMEISNTMENSKMINTMDKDSCTMKMVILSLQENLRMGIQHQESQEYNTLKMGIRSMKEV
jgi:hypothetical protein